MFIQLCSLFLLIGDPPADFTPIDRYDKETPFYNLFILCDEIFSHLLLKAEEDSFVNGIKLAPTAPLVNHLLFADDYIIFSRASL